jgi:hypothetical protein
MALHTSLPIHKTGYDLHATVAGLVMNLPRNVKATLGNRMLDAAMAMLLLVREANQASDKVPHISQLLERLEVLELLLRTCLDLRFISHGQWARAVELTDSIGKQAGGWRKQSTLERATSQPEQPGLFSFSAAAPAA